MMLPRRHLPPLPRLRLRLPLKPRLPPLLRQPLLLRQPPPAVWSK